MEIIFWGFWILVLKGLVFFVFRFGRLVFVLWSLGYYIVRGYMERGLEEKRYFVSFSLVKFLVECSCICGLSLFYVS